MKSEISLELIMQLHQFITAEVPVFRLSSSLIKLSRFLRTESFLFYYHFYFPLNGLFIHWNAELTSAENSLNVGPAPQCLSPESQLKTPDLCIFIVLPSTLLYS